MREADSAPEAPRTNSIGLSEVAALRNDIEGLGREVAELKATLARLVDEIGMKR